MKQSDITFEPLHQDPHLQLCAILCNGKRVGTERTIYPMSVANPFAYATYQHLRDDLTKPYGANPIGDAPLIVSPEDDPSHVGFMIPGWTTIKLFVQSFAEYPFVEAENQ